MTNDTENPSNFPEHKTTLAELVVKYEESTNVVTKGAYRDIIAGRIGITAHQDSVKQIKFRQMRTYLEACTFSFDSRKKMRDMFDMWFMR